MRLGDSIRRCALSFAIGTLAYGGFVVLSPPVSSLRWDADLTCGGTYEAPTEDGVRSARDKMVAATMGDAGAIGGYLSSLAEARLTEGMGAEAAAQVLHQTALDHGFAFNGRLLPIRKKPLDPSESDGMVIEYHATAKWLRDHWLPVPNTVVLGVRFVGPNAVASRGSVMAAVTDTNPFYMHGSHAPASATCPSSFLVPDTMRTYGYVHES